MASLACTTGSQISFSCPTDGAPLRGVHRITLKPRRGAPSVGQENYIWEEVKYTKDAILVGQFKYEKILTNF